MRKIKREMKNSDKNKKKDKKKMKRKRNNFEKKKKLIVVEDWRLVIKVVLITIKRMIKKKSKLQASALAFQTLLTLVPIIAVTVSIAAWLNLDEYRIAVERISKSYLVPEAAESVGRYIVETASSLKIKTLGVLGGLGLIALCVMLMLTVESAINEVFKCRAEKPIWARITISVCLLIIGPAAAAFSMYVTGKIIILPSILGAVKPLIATIPVIFICFHFIPKTKNKIRYSIVSAVITAILIESLKIGFAIYVKYLGNTLSYLYGTLAIIPMAMIWIYINWFVFLFGAELSAALHEKNEK